MRASRSAGSTTAPHFVILSTSLPHVALLRRCCRMMRASWHSRHVVVALACIGPGGRSAVTLATVGFWACTENGSAAEISNAIAMTDLRAASGNMHLHLIDGIVEIAAGVPGRGRRLRASLAIGRA